MITHYVKLWTYTDNSLDGHAATRKPAGTLRFQSSANAETVASALHHEGFSIERGVSLNVMGRSLNLPGDTRNARDFFEAALSRLEDSK